jgi:hypothetical protein
MKAKILLIGFAAFTLIGLGACASLGTPGNATTQALGTISADTAVAAPIVAAAVPVPWGPIAAGALVLISTLSGAVVAIAGHKVSTTQAITAVGAGANALATNLQANPSGGVAGALQAANTAAAAAASALIPPKS